MQIIRGLCLIALVCLPSLVHAQATGTTFPDTVDVMPEVFDKDNNGDCTGPTGSCVIFALRHNTTASALTALEQALGTDANWRTSSVQARLAAKVDTLGDNSLAGHTTLKYVNQVLNAGAYAGGDIGAQINAAVADCEVQAPGAPCRITIPPNEYTLTTAIVIKRAFTTLDCQGALLAYSGTQSAIRINIGTNDGSSNYFGDGYSRSFPSQDITVRNCWIDGTGSTTHDAQNTDTRAGTIVAYDVRRLALSNITISGSAGPGIVLRYVDGAAENLTVTGVGPYTGAAVATPVGLVAWGDGYGVGASGVPIVARNVSVVGVNGVGVQAVLGASLQGLTVRGTDDACLQIGASGQTAVGWIDVSAFDLSDCDQTASGLTGAVSDDPLPGNAQLVELHLSNGRLRRLASSGIELTKAGSFSQIRISDVSIECPGLTVATSSGISIKGAMGGVQLSNNWINYYAECSSSAPPLYGIYLKQKPAGSTLVGGGRISVMNNQLFGPSSNTKAGNGVYLFGENAGITGMVSGNHIQGFGNAAVLLQTQGDWTMLGSAQIIGNTFKTNCKTDATNCAAIDLSSDPALICQGGTGNGNFCTVDADCGGGICIVGSAISGVDIFANNSMTHPFSVRTQGQLVFNTKISVNDFAGDTDDYNLQALAGSMQEGFVTDKKAGTTDRAVSSITRVNRSGASIPKNDLVCLDTASDDGFVLCDGTHLTRILGILLETTADATTGTIATRGAVATVACTGTVSRGDSLEDAGGVVHATVTPVVGGYVGKALTACSSGRLTALLAVG